MNTSNAHLSPAEAARELGVSPKALRVYERHGLIAPRRSEAGWRLYGPEDLRRAREVVTLRAVGFRLTQITGLLADAAPAELAEALTAQQATLQDRLCETSTALTLLEGLRRDLAERQAPNTERAPYKEPVVAFDLPWPWGGERFVLHDLRALTYIVGPLFSGKTRLAQCLAEQLPNAAFLSLEREEDVEARLAADSKLAARAERTLARLTEDGAKPSRALTALIAGLETEHHDALVVDLVEQGLDAASQRALIAHLRQRGQSARPLFLMTRSNAVLDLAAVGGDETILFCPANHSPPHVVAPYPGAQGYEALASCLASPAVRARSEGVVACRSAVG